MTCNPEPDVRDLLKDSLDAAYTKGYTAGRECGRSETMIYTLHEFMHYSPRYEPLGVFTSLDSLLSACNGTTRMRDKDSLFYLEHVLGEVDAYNHYQRLVFNEKSHLWSLK